MPSPPDPRQPGVRLYGLQEAWRRLESAGLADPTALAERRLGEPVTDRASSWVRRVEAGGTRCYVKIYDYPTWRGRLRGALRNTWCAASRARRELAALTWLRDAGFEAPEPWLAWEERASLGFVRRAGLVTAEHPGTPLDRLLPQLDRGRRDALLRELERLVERLHGAGFRHRNLDLRNLLGRPSGPGWSIAVLDAPRHRIVAPGPAHDALARADWDRLARSVAAALGPGSAAGAHGA